MKVEARQHLGLCPLGCSKFACGLARVRPRSSSSGGRCCCRRERSKGRSSKSFSSRKKGVLAMTLNCRTWVWLRRPVVFICCPPKSSISLFDLFEHICTRLHPCPTCINMSRCGFSTIMLVLVFIPAKVLSYQAFSCGHLCPSALLFGGASFSSLLVCVGLPICVLRFEFFQCLWCYLCTNLSSLS